MRNPPKIIWPAWALWKRLTSMFKPDWDVDDYPVYTKFFPQSEPSRLSRRKPIPWTAQIINWPGMSGGGNTEVEAREQLRQHFAEFKAANKDLPRPGTKVPIQFADSTRVDRHKELRADFIRTIFDVEWAWISDESSLSDFHEDETDEKLIEKIRKCYGVDVSDICGGNLADILDRIAGRTVSGPN